MTRVGGLRPEGFDWDKGNKDKSLVKHKVGSLECEEIFFNTPIKFFVDESHSEKEERFLAYGVTNIGRKLTVVFTMRHNMIRVVSGRDQNKKERKIYAQS